MDRKINDEIKKILTKSSEKYFERHFKKDMRKMTKEAQEILELTKKNKALHWIFNSLISSLEENSRRLRRIESDLENLRVETFKAFNENSDIPYPREWFIEKESWTAFEPGTDGVDESKCIHVMEIK